LIFVLTNYIKKGSWKYFWWACREE